MLLPQVLVALLQFLLSTLAQSELGVMGVLLLLTIVVGIRARRVDLAVGAAVVFTLLMTQA
ncbi:hypothetical protein ACIF85_16870 [Streptomyces sp. NPDC086033]|uniref:hypothetical protein n=1 Tax=Streptomyces sp. NPDC086033 TaxID=3365747 RepID=UPI0037D777F0